MKISFLHILISVCCVSFFAAGFIADTHTLYSLAILVGGIVLCVYLLLKFKLVLARHINWEESKFKKLFNSSAIGFYETDEHGNVRDANSICHSMVKSLGGEKHEKWQDSFLHFLGSFEVDGELYKKLNDGNGTLVFESEIRSRCGRKHLFKHCIQLNYDANDQFMGLRGTIVDLTEQQLFSDALDSREKQLSIVMNSSFESVFIQDFEGNFLKVNKIFAGYAGAVSPEACAGLNIHNFLSPQVAEKVLLDIGQVVATGQSSCFTMPAVDSRGNKLRFEVCHNLLRNADGDPEAIIGYARELNNEEDCSSSSVDLALLDTLAHELRTPLAGMIGRLKVLEGTNLPEDAKNCVNKCVLSAQRFKDVVNNSLCNLSGKSANDFLLGGLRKASAKDPNEVVEPSLGLCILLAEDDMSSQVTMRRTLESWGHEVRTACTGVEVLSCIEEQDYDLVLMDVEMPEMNGYEAISMIRERENSTKKMPIIVMSAYNDDSDSKIMEKLGVTDFVSKPIRAEKLKVKLADIFQKENE